MRRWFVSAVWLALPLLYSQWFPEYSNTPRWILLSVATPALLILFYRPIRLSGAHVLGLGFLAWMTISLAWTPSLYEGVAELWKWVLLGSIFWLGSTLDARTIRWALWAFAAGIIVQLPLVIGQVYWDINWVWQSAKPAGLFANSNYLSEAVAVACVVAFLGHRWWLSILPGSMIWWSKSGGGAVGLGLAICAWLWGRNRWLAVGMGLLMIVPGVWYFRPMERNEQGGMPGNYETVETRLSLWANSTAAFLDAPWGRGVGSYWATYAEYHNAWLPTHPRVYGDMVRPRSAHNDAITLAVEGGVIGLALFAGLLWFCVFGAAGRKEERPDRPTLTEEFPYILQRPSVVYVPICILGSSLVGFPLHTPATSAVAALVLGWLAGVRRSVQYQRYTWRDELHAGNQAGRSG